MVQEYRADDFGARETVLVDEESALDSPRRFGVGAMIAALLLGLLLGAVGTTLHRTIRLNLPLGLLISLAMTLSAAVWMRAWRGLPALLGFGLGWIVAVELMSLTGPGGDMIVVEPTSDVAWASAGTIWNYLGIALIVLVAFLPMRWFADYDRVTDSLSAKRSDPILS